MKAANYQLQNTHIKPASHDQSRKALWQDLTAVFADFNNNISTVVWKQPPKCQLHTR